MKSEEILYHPVLNFVILLIGLSVCGAWWGVAAQASDAAVHMAMGPMPMSNPLDGFGFGDFWSLIWTGARIMFWLLFGLLGTFVLLVILASVGVLTWVVQQLAKGFVWLFAQFKSAAESTPIAKTPEGKTVSVKEVLEDHQNRITQLESKYDKLRLPTEEPK